MKSQKALGTAFASIALSNDSLRKWKFTLIKAKEDVLKVSYFPDTGLFARPCPTRPRHGFVDSRIIKNREELISLFEEAQKEDPEAEVMVGDKIDAICSAIYTGDGTLTVGPGHDGATAGKKSSTYPVLPTVLSKTMAGMSNVNQNPYFELVADKHNVFVVQMRDGPNLPIGSLDYIPATVKVKYVVEPHDDLLRWEEECLHFKPGTVVYGKGHGLSSHAAVHCIINKVPFIVTKKPCIDEILKASSQDISPLSSDEIWKGINIAAENNESLIKHHGATYVKGKDLNLGLAILHNWARLQYSKNSSFLLGFCLGTIASCGLAAIKGEMRHKKDSEQKNFEREKIYVDTSLFNKKDIQLLAKVGKIFNSDNFYNGYGGPLWANGSALLSQLAALMAKENWASALGTANKIINASHNGGFLLNKFTDDRNFDFAANEPGVFMASQIKRLFELENQNINNGNKIPYSRPDTTKYAAMSETEIIGLGEEWEGRLPEKGSLWYDTVAGIYKKSDCWFPLKITKNSICIEDKDNNIVWEIV